MSQKCPKCGSNMVPMNGGKGWRCGAPGNRWNGSKWSVCDGVVWNKNKDAFVRKVIERPADWLKIANPTNEQAEIMAALAVAPCEEHPRLKIFDASAGTGKTTQVSAGARVVARRVGVQALQSWYLCAFNKNADEAMQRKIPVNWPNISTINSFGGRLQGFNRFNYKTSKINTLFKDATRGLKEDERPRGTGLRAFADRMRDLLLYYPNPNDQNAWHNGIDEAMARFPALAKALGKGDEAIKVIRQYLPYILVDAMRDAKAIDFTEQYCRPALEAINRTGWKMPYDCVRRDYVWTDADIRHLADLIRAVRVPNCNGIIVDEAQDLSLSQIVLFLAATWRNGELILVGDDELKDENGELIKAGQAIFGWRGAFPGSLTLIARLWKALTGEDGRRYPLSITHRCPPEHCRALRALNRTLKSSKPEGHAEIFQTDVANAFQRWLDLPEGKTALWITRKNAPLAPIFLETIKSRKKVCLRGQGEMEGQLDKELFEPAGWRDDQGEYKVSLKDCIENMRAVADPSDIGDNLAAFLLKIAEEIQNDPSILREAELPAVPTVGNLRRFMLYFADKDAPRVCSTVYRSKGDEADLVVVDNTESFNEAWNGDESESRACRFVACSRSKETILLTGPIVGFDASACVPASIEAEQGEMETVDFDDEEDERAHWNR